MLRGKWLLENILGHAAAAAAAGRAGAARTRAQGERQSVRERLEEHRKNPVCATCHSQMDPLGFALEHFDAVGAWRTVDESRTPIDASGALPDGATFEGLPGLRTDAERAS